MTLPFIDFIVFYFVLIGDWAPSVTRNPYALGICVTVYPEVFLNVGVGINVLLPVFPPVLPSVLLRCIQLH